MKHLLRSIKRYVPQRLLLTASTFLYAVQVLPKLWGLGNEQRDCLCNLCNKKGRFFAYGNPPRYHAICPSCGSMERHRLLALIANHEDFFTAKSVLHFAPEPALLKYIKTKAISYVCADFCLGKADLRLDIQNIEQPDKSWDVVIASHVLEHVDDRLAIRELYRILKGGGIFLAMVPIIEAWENSYEDAAITNPAARVLHFGQHDHLRYYGRDFVSRLKAVGFSVRELTASPQQCLENGLIYGEKLFVCRKPNEDLVHTGG